MSGIDVVAIIVGVLAAFHFGRMAGRSETSIRIANSVERLRCPRCGQQTWTGEVAALDGLKNRGVITDEQCEVAKRRIIREGGEE